MPLVTLKEVSIGFRGPSLLDQVSTTIDEGQRVGLLGRNGAGKTTLMRMISGQVIPDAGSITVAPGVTVALLQQDVPEASREKISDVVANGWIASGSENEPWEAQNASDQIISRMELNPDAEFGSLSSGMKRRVLLAKALVSNPDLLLLDEPTNHLDIEAIDWLEKFLQKWKGAIVFVTHDRMFLRRMANRILEIDRGKLFDWTCDYDTFLKRKQEALAAEEKQNALFDKKLAEEERWIRQGIKARRTRNEGRVRALEKLRNERRERREKIGTSNLTIQSGQRSGNLVIEAKDISFSYDERQVVSGFSTTILRGDKIGIIGPNGAGKTTLLRLLLGELSPDTGKVRQGSNLQIAYFDQLRQQLDPHQTVQENVGDGYDFVMIGENKKHVLGYLQEFLFTPERARTEIRFLSGGERNRILLAKLFAKPANVVVLDEPTNDLDAETLEMLEERLVDYKGTILTVSHDREFLNNIATSTIVFEQGNIKEYDGGYDDWIRQRPTVEKTSVEEPRKAKVAQTKPTSSAGTRKLKFKEQKELEELPDRIDQLESRIAEIHTAMSDPEFFQQDGTLIAARQAELKELEQSLARNYARWEELEEIASG